MEQSNRTIIRSAKETLLQQPDVSRIAFSEMVVELLQEVIAMGDRDVERMKQELVLIENSILHVHKRADKYYFSCRPDGAGATEKRTEVFISQEAERIHALARRSFLDSKIRKTSLQIGRMKRIAESVEAARCEHQLRLKLGRYDAAGLDLCRIIFTREQNAWIEESYAANPFFVDDLNYLTRGKVIVRSKSEAMIGSALESIGCPYRADDLVRIISSGQSEKPYRDTYYADFKVPNLLGGITIHEHFGAFQMEQYGDNALKRLNDYHNFKIIELPGRPVADDEITFSFESDLRSKKGLNKIIRRMLLPPVW